MTDSVRVLGLDAGERRIGVAISDPLGRFALPLESLRVDGGEMGGLSRLAREQDVGSVVVGLPLSLSGEDTAQTQRAREFGRRVEEQLGLPVEFCDERLSSREAERAGRSGEVRRDGRKGGRKALGRGRGAAADTDAIAASIILQAYLDTRSFGAE